MIGLKVFVSVVALAAGTLAANPLPTVDLGYAIHRATVNATGYGYYNFSNIRYGAAPLGANRFSAPLSPTGRNTTVNNGEHFSICPQSNPLWESKAVEFLGEYLTGVPLANITASLQDPPAGNSPPTTVPGLLSLIPKPAPGTSEDCLFLDVFVPKKIFAAKKKKRNSKGAPVLVWIYGGGFTGGSKVTGNPATLLARSQNNGGEGVIFVAMNYRLGLFGWLSGPTFQESGTANVGLYDQRLALDWVQKNIHLFGGDPSRVTLIGESAGGSSILHQITAYGGLRGSVPFQQAILQSPGFLPMPSNVEQESIFQSVLSAASSITQKSITSLSDLRSLNTTELYLINFAVTAGSPWGSFTFGPAVDGRFAPALPGELLLHGQFDKSLKIMVGHNSNEGLFFTNPLIQNETAVAEYFAKTQPAASPAVISYILNTLYPPIFDGSHGYVDYIGRLSLLVSELSFTCNTRYLDTAYHDKTYSYYFTVPPGLHGEDIAYTFFNGDTSTSDDGLAVQPAVAAALQEYITSFAISGTPNEKGVPFFPLYGSNSSTEVLGIANLGSQVKDTAANARCAWWQKALYY